MAALCEETVGHQDIVDSVYKGMEKEKDTINHAQLSKAMFDAAKSGNNNILELLSKCVKNKFLPRDTTLTLNKKSSFYRTTSLSQ